MADRASDPRALVSVVVACRGPLARTRRCLAALLCYTRPPCELIAVQRLHGRLGRPVFGTIGWTGIAGGNGPMMTVRGGQGGAGSLER